jgi:glycine dehydrogenase subunit 1
MSHRYLPTGEQDEKKMLEVIGIPNKAALFNSIPAHLRVKGELALPPGESEQKLRERLAALAEKNLHAAAAPTFLGGGAYHHFVPVAVDYVLQRTEFYTSYTPYQPEISQGTLTAVFEFQTYVSLLTGAEAANASLYDGAMAAAEAALMAMRLTGREKIVLAANLNPSYKQVVRSYLLNLGTPVVEAEFDAKSGKTKTPSAETLKDSATFIFQSPNYFGVLEDVPALCAAAKAAGAISTAVVTEALAMGLMQGPASEGADIVCGEMASFGPGLNYGGPYLGFLATSMKNIRQMPGRLVGETNDFTGRRGYCLTLAAREQHIRREKATSNICTNEGLIALAATVFLSILGKHGLHELALENFNRASYLKNQLKAAGYPHTFEAPFFNELVITTKTDPVKLNERLLAAKIVGGLPLGKDFPSLKNGYLLCVTEMNCPESIDRFVELLKSNDR